MSVRTAVLGHGLTSVANTPTLSGPVPSTGTWIVKDVRVYNANAGPANILVYANSNALGINIVILTVTLAADAISAWQGWLVLGPGDSLVVLSNQAQLGYWVSGSELAGHV